MTIKEQIEIARLIASGTPREVAILESSAIEKSGPTVDVDAVSYTHLTLPTTVRV